jgi:hypothetical protein
LIWVVGDSGCFSHRRILVINPWGRFVQRSLSLMAC